MSTPIVAWINAFSDALAPPLFALALVWLRQHQINTRVIEAVGRAAGEAYRQMVQTGGTATDPIATAAAVAEGRNYLLARIPDALKSAGITPESAAQMVSAELGKLLAIDPTIGLGAPPSRIAVHGADAEPVNQRTPPGSASIAQPIATGSSPSPSGFSG